MALKEELNLSKPLSGPEHEAILGIYYTAATMKKKASDFLQTFGLTDVQLNLLMMLKHQGGAEGLSQARLSELMVVGKANVTGLIDRLERDGLVCRTATSDRRYNIIQLTPKGQKLLDKIEPLYAKEVHDLMGQFKKQDLKKLVELLDAIRKHAAD
jgi:MarR family transcriptional regulator, 2-MHQ and catechol-resistance regulon repressor